MKCLLIDVGYGTEDILFYNDEEDIEDNIKLVLPSQTRLIAEKIRRLKGKEIFLRGYTMGGGPSVKAIREHLKSADVYATREAAMTVRDDLNVVEKMGIKIVGKDFEKDDVIRIDLKDVDLDFLEEIGEKFCFGVQRKIAIAVQDHGHKDGISDREFRFKMIEDSFKNGGKMDNFVFAGKVPEYLTRLSSLQKMLKERKYEPLLMDTGPAAIFGCLEDETVSEKENKLIINVGNGHTLAAILAGEKISGIFEHHTRSLTATKLEKFVKKLCDGRLTFKEVFDDGGHGACIKEVVGFENIDIIAVTGPKRRLLKDGKLKIKTYMAAPHGDMMLTGCYGLLNAFKNLR
jgi:uncharacterized protein (DUF1786 family)